MKAVILSGGRGTRLAPLTDRKPKPLVRVGDEPIIFSIIRNLKKEGFNECAVTLGYRGDDIRNALGEKFEGVKIHYFEEKEPLGTAGAVKNCEEFLDSDFLVLSGDALCDIALDEVIACHKMSGDIATLVLTPCREVLEYGVVLLDKGGKVARFSEKPAWEGVKSDRVNCGIYALKREILDLIPKGTACDFSKDVFPMLLEKKTPINTFINKGFWCDVGSPWALYSCNMKTLARDFFITYEPKNIQIKKSARVHGSVIGEGSTVEADAELHHAVIGKSCKIGEGAVLDGCLMGDGVIVEKNARVEKGAVIGDGCYISEGRCIAEGKRLSADTRLEGVGGEFAFSKGCLFEENSGFVIDKSSPEDFFALGRALKVLGDEVGIFYSSSQSAHLAATEASLGIAWSGGEGVIFGEGKKKDASFMAGRISMPTVHFSSGEKIISVSVFDSDSLSLSRERERALCHAFERPPASSGDGSFRYFDGGNVLLKQYFLTLLSKPTLSNGKVKIKNNSEGKRFLEYAPRGIALSSPRPDGDFYIEIFPDRENISLEFDGMKLDTEHIHALILKYLISHGKTVFSLPSHSPLALDRIAKSTGAEILRTSKCEKNDKASRLAFRDIWARDTLFASALLYKVIEAHSFSKNKLRRTVESLPVFLRIEREIDTGRMSSGRVMRLFGEQSGALSVDTGIEMHSDKGDVTLTPNGKSRLKILAEAQNAEFANELCAHAEDIVKKLSTE